MPVSHLLLKGGQPTSDFLEPEILYAASFAAGYSKGRDAGKVEVIVAQGWAVQHPHGCRLYTSPAADNIHCLALGPCPPHPQTTLHPPASPPSTSPAPLPPTPPS